MIGRLRPGWFVLGLLVASVPAAAARAATEDADAQGIAAWQELQVELAHHLQAQGDPRQQLVAAMLLAWPIDEYAPAALQAAAAARKPEAQAIFARLRAGAEDSWVLWIAAIDCHFGDALCDRDGAIDALLRIETDNAAIWLLALDRASRDGDREGQLAALQGMAASTRFERHYLDAIRAWTEAFDALPELPAFEPLVRRGLSGLGGGTLGREDVRTAVGLAGLNFAMVSVYPPFGVLSDHCVPEEIDDAAWREACRGAARVLVQSDSLVAISVGLSVAFRFATDDAERSALEQRRREKDWLTEGTLRVDFDRFYAQRAPDVGKTLSVVEHWRSSRSEVALFQSVLREHGMPLEPPADYLGSGSDLAAREADRQQQRLQSPTSAR